ncbi:RHS repeat-associated core domain-containing protein [Streptomyces sp. NPDC059378]|uniref:RHS repeat-associated core domain-containing protein n=1 Tax=Streptomyces sp. NPDC059378 TaxID=3346815 RepID=UPI0036B99946
MFLRPRRRRNGPAATVSRTLRLTVGSLVLALSVPIGLAPMAQAADALGRPHTPKTRSAGMVPADPATAQAARARLAGARARNRAEGAKALAAQHATWPSPARAGLVRGRRTEVGGLPVTLTAPTTPSGKDKDGAKAKKAKDKAAASATTAATVQVLGRKEAAAAGIKGVLLSVTADRAGTTGLDVDYSSFASAYGGDWAGRLRLVQLPACALTTPQKASCRTETPLAASRNDIGDRTVSARVTTVRTPTATAATTAQAAPATAVVALAAAAGESASGSGAYTATPLSPSSSWQAGGSSGSFSWSYPMGTPAPAAGPAPSITLSYDSGAIDGRTANSNNQGSIVGEGFDLSSASYVERSYGSCDDDGQDEKFDMCWKYDNASLVLNGKSTTLVKDDSTGTWRLKDDDASTVTHGTGADNGDDDGEYWTVTTGNGTKYVFGQNKLDGAGTERTNSTWTVPVFGDDSGEPGYSNGTAFADRALTQAWRWNLDYVEDVHGNAMSYWYTAETNSYAKNKATTATADYTRGGYLTRILYGQRKDALFTGTASHKVTFDYAERCTAADCSDLKDSTADHWPDVPFDSICKNGDDCDSKSPSFFTRKRLTGVNSFAWDAANSTYTAVDSWAFTQHFYDGGDLGDTSDQVLVLDSITRTGKAGSDIALPPVTFTYDKRPNRVDGTDDIVPLYRPRIRTLISETGAVTTVTLSDPECVRGQTPDEDDDHASCYPVYWHINGAAEAGLDWFHKYRVLAVTTTDPTGKNATTETDYTYSDPAWHYDENPLTPQDERTWSQWRGYGKVTAVKGTDAVKSKTVTLFMQGMNGDRMQGSDGKLDPTARKSVSVKAVAVSGLTVADQTDSEQYAGFTRQQVTYDGSRAVEVTVNDPWSKVTSTQHASYADTEAYFVRTGRTATSTYLTAKDSWRTHTTSTTFDAYGMKATEDDAGDTAKSGDETCTRTWYARNTTKGINSLVSRIRTVGRTCATGEDQLALPTKVADRGDVLSDTATVYDNTAATAWSASQTPTLGDASWTGRAAAYPATVSGGERAPTAWQTTAKTGYDTLGRPTSVTDAANYTTTTAYTPAAAGPPTLVIKTNAATQKTFTYYELARGNVIRSFDINNKQTQSTYDALGRVTAVWLPNRTSDQPASYVYDYGMSNTAPSWTSTGAVKADGDTYETVYSIFDAQLRPIQTQKRSPEGGRILTDTRYDSRGLAYETYADVYDSKNAPSGTYARAEYGGTAKQTATTFDGAERPVTSTFFTYGVQRWSTTTSYTGDSTATTAVQGASAKRVITDALGRTVETRQYATTSPDDAAYGGATGTAYSSTKFSYTLDDKQATVTGPDNSAWSWTYDLFGRQVKSTDPDKGTETTGYDNRDLPAWTKDGGGRVVITAYDKLRRPTATYKAPADADLTSTTEEQTPANQLTALAYDPAGYKGQLSSSTRYTNGATDTVHAYTRKVTSYDSLYNPLESTLTLPGDDPMVTSGAVPSATLSFSANYDITGAQNQDVQPAAGGLPKEIIDTGYNDYGLPATLSGTQSYVLASDFTATDKVQQLTLGISAAAGVKKAYVSNTWDEGTDRLTQSVVTDDTHAWQLQQLNYDYDQAGNVTSLTDPTTLGGTSSADNQCFAYDGYQRLTEAWTPKTADCSATGRTSANLGGPAPYWTSYAYNTAGQRTTETSHGTTGTTTSRTYCYNSTTQPHTLTATPAGTASGVCTGVTAAYGYDAAGDTTARPDGTATQSLVWDAEGKLGSLKETSGSTTSTTGYIYDTDGNLLVRRNTSGESVLYLGATEVHYNAVTGKKWAQRSYSLGGTTVAVRSNQSGTSTLTWLAADRHNTAGLALTATDQAITRRYTTPFGADRGTAVTTWPDDKKFLGKSADAVTGLTHVGAREYDPLLGQFISVDPLLDTSDGQSLNGYAYADNSPLMGWDPDGKDNWWADPTMNKPVEKGGTPISQDLANEQGFGSLCNPNNCSGFDPNKMPAGGPAYEYPKVQAEDANRPGWGTLKTTPHDKTVFFMAGSMALSFVAMNQWKRGFNLMEHWMENGGETVELNVADMMNSLSYMRKQVGEKIKLGHFDSGWKPSSVADGKTQGMNKGADADDYYFALNGYQYRVRGDTVMKRGQITGTVTVDVYKRYNWGNIAGGKPRKDLGYGPFRPLKQNDLAHLNSVGLARDFDVIGHQTFNIG